jgi:pSer/pThr/pTyr-binding forkhead associated (FHA) protein
VSARLIGRTGATAGQDFVLMDVATIGASRENQIRIAAPGVSRRHARVVKDKDEYFVEDAGATNGTFLNGGRITREQLQHLDVITLGRAVDLIFVRRQGDTRPPLVDGITGARLTIADGADAGTVIDVPKGELTLGRAPSCNVVLASGLISKVHARVQRTPNQVVLQDLQSINGTFVNGSRVDSVVVLKNGDRINLGGVRELKVGVDGNAALEPSSAAIADELSFSQEWKTRFVWAPDELALIEQARAEAMQLAALRAPAAPAAPAADKKPIAAKPAAPKPAPPRPAPPPAVEAGAAKPAPPKADPAAAAKPQPAKPAPPAGAAARGVPAGGNVEMTRPIRPADRVEEATEPRPGPAPGLRGIRLIGPGGPITLGTGSFVVGRAGGSDVRLDDRQISRSHALITIDGSSAVIEDLQTVNGTLVNGREVKARQRLNGGDILQFGASQFRVELV